MGRRAAVVTVGARRESLGALKLARWLRRTGWEVEERAEVGAREPLWDHGRWDLVCLSAVFSWRLPDLVRMARFARTFAEVWVGGPAVTFHPRNAEYVRREAGVEPHAGLDGRFEGEPGDYPMVYFSRGCPAYTPACGFCPVPRIEGNAFRLYPDARPAPLLLDNNLSALPADYQGHIIRRYAECWRGGKVDANSGFEPHSFTAETLGRWSRFPLRYWRFGYDDLSERGQALAMMRLFRREGIGGDRVRVYTLAGNEPPEACHQRVREVIEHGMTPWPQRLRPLDYLGGPLPCSHGWDEPTLIAFQRYYSLRALWGRVALEDFEYQGRRPLRHLARRRIVSLPVVR
jgi:hypothetical protein